MLGLAVESRGIGMGGPHDFGDSRDARRIGARVIEQHAVADLDLVAQKVPRLVVPHAVPARRPIGLGHQVANE